VQHWLDDLCQRRHEVFGLPLFVAGVGIIAVTIVQLLRMNEEDTAFFGRLDMRSYHRFQPGDKTIQTGVAKRILKLATRPTLWILNGMTPPEREVESWPRYARGSVWERSRLWKVGTGDFFPLWPFTIFFFLIFSSMYITPPHKPAFTMLLN